MSKTQTSPVDVYFTANVYNQCKKPYPTADLTLKVGNSITYIDSESNRILALITKVDTITGVPT